MRCAREVVRPCEFRNCDRSPTWQAEGSMFALKFVSQPNPLLSVIWPLLLLVAIGSLVAAAGEGTKQQLNSAPTLLLQSGHADIIRALRVSPDGRIAASGSDDLSMRIWDMKTGRELRHISVGASVQSIDFSPDGRLVATISNQEVAVWGISDGREVRHWSFGISTQIFPRGVAFNSNGTRVIATDVQWLFVWDVRNGQLVHKEFLPKAIRCSASRRGNALVALCQGTTVLLWDSDALRSVKTLGPAKDSPGLSDDIKRSLQHRDEWSLKQGLGLTMTDSNPVTVQCLDFAPDLKTIVTNHFDGTIRRWDVDSGNELFSQSAQVYSAVSIDSTGTMLAASPAIVSAIKLADSPSNDDIMLYSLPSLNKIGTMKPPPQQPNKLPSTID